MNFVAVEFDNRMNNTHVLGYLRTPNNFHPLWSIGFRQYLSDKYKVKDGVRIYPLRVKQNSDNMGKDLPGYTDMEEDFISALKSNYYYPICATNDSIRRQWSMFDPAKPDYYL